MRHCYTIQHIFMRSFHEISSQVYQRHTKGQYLWRKSNLPKAISLYITLTAGIYLSKFNTGNTRTMCEISSKLTVKTPERHLVFLMLTLSIYHLFVYCFHCWIWTSKYRLENVLLFQSIAQTKWLILQFTFQPLSILIYKVWDISKKNWHAQWSV